MKKIISFVLILTIISLVPTVFAQITIGEPAHHKLITISISEEGEVHVIHEIRRVSSPVNVEVLEGTVSNLSVIDEEGNPVTSGKNVWKNYYFCYHLQEVRITQNYFHW